MATTLTSNGRVTLAKRIRDARQLVSGASVEFSVNAAGEVVLQPARPPGRARQLTRDHLDAVRGRADAPWRTDALMTLLRADA